MNIQDEIKQLQARLDELTKKWEQEPDYSDWVGRLVDLADAGEDRWHGPAILDKVKLNNPFPFVSKTGFVAEQARLYQGPFKINLTPWHGGECPIDGDSLVLVQLRDDDFGVCPASYFRWSHLGYESDIVAYAVIEV